MNRKAVLAAAGRILKSVELRVPLDVHAIAAAHGLELEKERLEDAIIALMVTNTTGALITMNSRLSANEERFALAHALGHYLLHSDNQSVFIDRANPAADLSPKDRKQAQQENEANEFAAELLMPETIVRERFATRRPYPYNERSLRPLAAQLGTSELALAVRLTKLGLSDA